MRCLGPLCALFLLMGCATSAEPVEAPSKPRRSAPRPAEESRTPPADAGAPEEKSASIDASTARGGGGIASAPAPEPFGDVGFKEVSEKDWLAGIRDKLAQQLKIEPAELRFSPGRLHAVFVRSTPPPTKPVRRPPPRRHQIITVDNQGRRLGQFRAITAHNSDEPPKDLRFLSEDRLIYEVVASPPPAVASIVTRPTPTKTAPHARKAASKPRAGARAATKPKPPKPEPARVASDKPSPPTRLFVIQPIAAGSRPIRCEGLHFAFTHQNDRVAFVGGNPEAGFVAVDGVQVFPRRGRTVVSSAPVWSKDGRSLAFLETPAGKPPRLVLLAEFDNPTGDTTWDLPAATAVDGTRVFWAGSSKLLVGKTALRPIFSASFEKSR